MTIPCVLKSSDSEIEVTAENVCKHSINREVSQCPEIGLTAQLKGSAYRAMDVPSAVICMSSLERFCAPLQCRDELEEGVSGTVPKWKTWAT